MSAAPGRREYGAGKILLIIFGSLALLVSLGLLAGGSALLWADRTQRDAQGYLNTSTERVDSGAYAVVARDLMVEIPGWLTGPERLGTMRVSVTPSQAGAQLFVGIAPRANVDAYLAGVARDEVTHWPGSSSTLSLGYQQGGAPAGTPATQQFWVASSSGAGERTLTWDVRGGTWAVVAMNADGSRGLSFDVRAGGTVPFVLPVGIALVSFGILVLLLGVLMLVLGARPSRVQPVTAGPGWAPQPPPPGWVPPPPPPSLASRFSVYPVALEGHLDEPMSRWLWLVKWLLALPHYFVLALLAVPFVVLSVVAWFAILFTGRYPRSIFDFNLGVLRWWWRVSFYTYSALGTDRYPPFSLGEEPDYPARLDIAYPEQLSRGLVLVKSWLLAIPHLLIVGLLLGGTWSVWHEHGGQVAWSGSWGGVIGLLVFVAGLLLLFTARYPRSLFDLVMGLNRWVFRVIAYVALMRDEYPPFRLDMGETEPATGGGPAPAAGSAALQT